MLHKVASIGFGGMATHHFNQSKCLDMIELKGIYDIDPKRREVERNYGLYM